MSFYFASDISSGVLNADATGANNPRIGYQNLVNASNLTVSSWEELYPDTNLLTPSTYDYWKSISTAAQTLDWTPADNSDGVDYIAICGHNFHEGDGIEVKLQRRATSGAAWTDVHTCNPDDPGPVVIHFAETTNPFLRITLSPNGAYYPRAANLLIGKMLVFPRRVYVGHTPINYSRNASIARAISENGEYLGHTVRNLKLSTGVDFKNIDEDFYRSDIAPFVEHAESGPFVWCWRPTKYPDETAYCWTTGDTKMSNDSNGRVSFNFDIMAKVYA
jgi:hypothetical protein